MSREQTSEELARRIEQLEGELEERKREIEELRRSQVPLKTLSDASFEALFLSEQGVCLGQNQTAETMFGYTPAEAVGRHGVEWIAPEDRDQVRHNMLSGYQEPYQVTALRKDGTTFPCEIQARTTDYQGRPIRISALRDITQRKRAEEALRSSQDKLRDFINSATDSAALFDSQLNIVEVNDAHMNMFHPGMDRAHLIGKNLREIVPNLEETGRLADLLGVIETGDSFYADDIVPHLTFGDRYLSLKAFRTTDGLGTLTRDVTEHKRAEQEKLAFERQVQHAQKLESLGVLAGGIAHDFNNLLVGILGYADLALDELSSMSPVRNYLQGIVEASKRAAELARQMLAYSGKGRFVIEPIDGNRLVEEITHLVEISISKKAVLKYNLADKLPSFDGDVTQIRQIIMNLITNASEAIGDRTGVVALSTGAMDCDRAYLDDINETLRAALDEPLPEGIYSYLEVADTGCGMDAETSEKLFDPFFTTKLTGRGLGMSAVLGIVRGHKGALKIQSEVGKGTRFRVLFPANVLPEDGFAVRKQAEAEREGRRGSGIVLLADDDETVRAVGKRMLERMGFSVLTARDGREALSLFRKDADDIVCVLLDLTMPEMDGEEAFGEMRRLRPGVAVILCSGYNEQDATQRFAGKGLAGFIQKPFDMDALREKLADV